MLPFILINLFDIYYINCYNNKKYRKNMNRNIFINTLVNIINTSDSSYAIEGLFINNSTLSIQDYKFDIFIYSLQSEKFNICRYILKEVDNIRNIGINENNITSLIDNKNALEFAKKELLKNSIETF
jgi:hypothetical protein